jgi:polysaccharide biosynthesis/export protein
MPATRTVKKILAFFIAVTLLSGCGGPVVKNPLPLSSPEMRSPYPEQEYRIQIGDQLDIKFFYNPELNDQLLVRPDGRISLQLVGEVKTLGLTPGELTALLEREFTPLLARPKVAVMVRSVALSKVFVDGEVSAPRTVDLIGPMSSLQSIAAAGGFKDTARRDEVIVIRRGEAGKSSITTLNLAKVIDGTDIGQDIQLAPFDIVYVPKSKIANVNLWVDQYLAKTILVPGQFLLYYGVVTH